MSKDTDNNFAAKFKSIIDAIPGNIYAILVLFIVFGLICDPNTFLTFGNFMNIVEQFTILSIIAIASLLAIITRGIDLSLGATMSFAGVLVATLIHNDWNILLAMLLTLVAGVLVGMLNGVIISRTMIAPFIITLGTMNIAKSLALIVSDNRTVAANIPAFRQIAGGKLWFIPYTVFIVLIVYIIFNYITQRRRWGRHLYALGGNETAARLSGINVQRVKFITYAVNGGLAALAGIILASRLGSANPGQGEGYEFYGIASAVVGGASMTGGKGTVWRTLSGAFIISALRNGLNMAGLPVSLQMIVLGFVIIGVVTFDTFRGKTRREKIKA